MHPFFNPEGGPRQPPPRPGNQHPLPTPPVHFSPHQPRFPRNPGWDVYHRSPRPRPFPPLFHGQRPAPRPPHFRPPQTSAPPLPRPPPLPSPPRPPSYPPPQNPTHFPKMLLPLPRASARPEGPSPNPNSIPESQVSLKDQGGKGKGLPRWGPKDGQYAVKEEVEPNAGEGVKETDRGVEPVLIDLTEEPVSGSGDVQADAQTRVERGGKEKRRRRKRGRGRENPAGNNKAHLSPVNTLMNRDKVLIDGQNVAYYGKGNVHVDRAATPFRWENLFAAVDLCLNAGVTPVVVLKKFGLSFPPPKEVAKYVEYVSPADNVKDHDDSALLNMAIAFGCRYISNDNFRNFRIRSSDGSSRSGMIASFLKDHQDERQVYFIISDDKFIPTSANGAFLLKRRKRERTTRGKGRRIRRPKGIRDASNLAQAPVEARKRKRTQEAEEPRNQPKKRAVNARTYAAVAATNDPWCETTRKPAFFDVAGHGTRLERPPTSSRQATKSTDKEGERNTTADPAKTSKNSKVDGVKRSKRKAEDSAPRQAKRARKEPAQKPANAAKQNTTESSSTQRNLVEGKKPKPKQATKQKKGTNSKKNSKKKAAREKQKKKPNQPTKGKTKMNNETTTAGKGEEAKAVVLSWARLTGLHREGWNGHKNYFRCPTCKAGFMSFFLCLEHMVVYTNHFPMEKKITPEELYYKLLIKSKEAQEYNRQRQTNYLPTFDPERTVAHHLYVCPQRGCGVGSKTSEKFLKGKHVKSAFHGRGSNQLTKAQRESICTRPGWQEFPYDLGRCLQDTESTSVPELEAIVGEKADYNRDIWRSFDCRVLVRESIFLQSSRPTKLVGRLIGVMPGNGSLLATSGVRKVLCSSRVDASKFRKLKASVLAQGSHANESVPKMDVSASPESRAMPVAKGTGDDSIEISKDSIDDTRDVGVERSESSELQPSAVVAKPREDQSTDVPAEVEEQKATDSVESGEITEQKENEGAVEVTEEKENAREDRIEDTVEESKVEDNEREAKSNENVAQAVSGTGKNAVNAGKVNAAFAEPPQPRELVIDLDQKIAEMSSLFF